LTEKTGIKETLEVLDLGFEIAKFIRRETRGDGFQRTDIIKFLMSAEGRESFTDALTGMTDISGEIRDLSLAEGFDLAKYAVKRAQEIVEDTAA